jgi:hypothetical protein
MGKKMKLRGSAHECESEQYLFPLEGLLPAGQALNVNMTYPIITLVSTSAMIGNPMLLQRSLTECEMRLLLPLLAFPHCCPYEFLRSSLFCSYERLLTGLFSSEGPARGEWQTTVAEQRLLLQCAQEDGTWKKALKPLYNTLSNLRPKLRPFGLEIAVSASRSAYALISLSVAQPQAGGVNQGFQRDDDVHTRSNVRILPFFANPMSTNER